MTEKYTVMQILLFNAHRNKDDLSACRNSSITEIKNLKGIKTQTLGDKNN